MCIERTTMLMLNCFAREYVVYSFTYLIHLTSLMLNYIVTPLLKFAKALRIPTHRRNTDVTHPSNIVIFQHIMLTSRIIILNKK